MTTPTKPPAQLPAAVVDHDAQTITLAVTFDWRREGIHLDHCEAGVLVGEVRRALVAHFRGAEWNQLAALRSVMTWEPNEERLVGLTGRPQPLYEPTVLDAARADPMDARVPAFIGVAALAADIKADVPRDRDGFVVQCNTCGKTGGRHTYQCSAK